MQILPGVKTFCDLTAFKNQNLTPWHIKNQPWEWNQTSSLWYQWSDKPRPWAFESLNDWTERKPTWHRLWFLVSSSLFHILLRVKAPFVETSLMIIEKSSMMIHGPMTPFNSFWSQCIIHGIQGAGTQWDIWGFRLYPVSCQKMVNLLPSSFLSIFNLLLWYLTEKKAPLLYKVLAF